MSKGNFRIGLIFTPNTILSVGVLNGNDQQAYEFIGEIQPLIDDFMNRVREVKPCNAGKLDKNVSLNKETL